MGTLTTMRPGSTRLSATPVSIISSAVEPHVCNMNSLAPRLNACWASAPHRCTEHCSPARSSRV
eukprot:6255463-Prymnesium_polylepis.1